LDDGSISIPVFEEELVVTKRVVLKERIVLRKRIETVTETVVDELRKERIEIEPDDSVRDRVRIRAASGGLRRRGGTPPRRARRRSRRGRSGWRASSSLLCSRS
jgi:hypothetical protein